MEHILFQWPVFGNLDGVKERDWQSEKMNNPFCFKIQHGGQTGVHLSGANGGNVFVTSAGSRFKRQAVLKH